MNCGDQQQCSNCQQEGHGHQSHSYCQPEGQQTSHEVAVFQLAALSTLVAVVNGILVAAVGKTRRLLKVSSATIVNVKVTWQETVLVVWRMMMTIHQPDQQQVNHQPDHRQQVYPI